ncbi:MAG: MBL fold metallo-hydrolase [Chitinophagaceae bacterium]
MIQIQSFTFNPFQENTFILYNEHKEAIIIDPGMYDKTEQQVFFDFIEKEQIKPILLLNTHTHLDHIFGNAAVLRKFQIPSTFHELDKPVFNAASSTCALYNLNFEKAPEPSYYTNINDTLLLGEDEFQLFLTPGHSPGSICIYHAKQAFVIAGDVLFQMSIGRSDLPGGNHKSLIQSIHTSLMPLPDHTKVYCGHGPSTTIGIERMNNPFLH